MTTDIKVLKQQSKLPATRAGGAVVAEFFEHNKGAILAVLPEHLSADRLLKIALTAVRNTPRLLECTVESLFGAAMECAQLGLEPNTAAGHAYLVPFKDKKRGATEVQVITGYKGYIELARRSSEVVHIYANEIRENDLYEYELGDRPALHHRPLIGDQGEIIAFYAVALLAGGQHVFELMPKADVDRIKSSRNPSPSSPWVTHYEQMGRKTAIRRLCKVLPSVPGIERALQLDGAADRRQPQRLADNLKHDAATTIDFDSQAMIDGFSEDFEPVTIELQEKDGDSPASTPPTPADWPKKITLDETGEEAWQDSSGELFDPQIHGQSANGTPSVKSDGTFRAKRRPRAQQAQVEQAAG